MQKERNIDTDQLTQIIIDACIEKKAKAISVLNLEQALTYGERFVICSGSSSRQVRAIAQHVTQVLKKDHDTMPLGVEGRGLDKWVLVDFGSVILHVFTSESRGYYSLESLWVDAPKIPLSEFGVTDPDALSAPESDMFV